MTAASYVFIGGVHRSGTTLMANLLSAHSQVAALTDTGVPEHEGQHLQTALPTAKDHGGPGRFALHPDAHLTEASRLARASTRTALLSAWEPYWSCDAPVRVEKSPPNLLRMRLLRSLFPQAVLVMVVRHPVPVSLATRRSLGSQASMPTLVRNWLAAHRVAWSDSDLLGDVIVVRYEDLVTDPRGWTGRVWQAAGLKPEAIDHPVLDTASNDRYISTWHARPLPAAIMRMSYGRAVRRFGYHL